MLGRPLQFAVRHLGRILPICSTSLCRRFYSLWLVSENRMLKAIKTGRDWLGIVSPIIKESCRKPKPVKLVGTSLHGRPENTLEGWNRPNWSGLVGMIGRKTPNHLNYQRPRLHKCTNHPYKSGLTFILWCWVKRYVQTWRLLICLLSCRYHLSPLATVSAKNPILSGL